MRALIEKAFPKTTQNSCIESLQEIEFGIFDPAVSKCFIQAINKKSHFYIKNPKQKVINFLAIDKCLFFDSDEHKKCDFAVFDDKAFCFVEIKDSDKKVAKLKDARKQLLETIKLFQEKISFESIKRIEVYASIGHTPSRPAALASDSNNIFEFRNVGAKLFQEGNEKVFQ